VLERHRFLLCENDHLTSPLREGFEHT
jgi:hypothetical protein